MTSLSGDEPDLELGATGEGVLLLQVRLYALGLYRQVPDSTYDSATEQAVRELQSQLGLDNSGEVDRATWEALLHQEQQYGIQYQYQSPYDALAQINYDLEHPGDAAGGGYGGAGELSPDGQWRWDGNDWQPAGGAQDGGGYGGRRRCVGRRRAVPGRPVAVGRLPVAGGGRHGRPGRHGRIRGRPRPRRRRRALTRRAVALGRHRMAAGARRRPGRRCGGGANVGLVSDDGQWRWDGTQWQVA